MSQNQRAANFLSQNFLVNSDAVRRIVRKAGLQASDHIIEIGPGRGSITRRLADTRARVTAIELDRRLYEKLCGKFAGRPQVSLHCQDFLKWNLPARGGYKIFSNIPFSITTDIVRKLSRAKNPPAEAWLVMEKGAAKRFLGKPHESAQSLLIKPIFDLEICYYFRREDFLPRPGVDCVLQKPGNLHRCDGSFLPRPGVDCVLLHMTRKTPPDVTRGQWKAYERFVGDCAREGVSALRRTLSHRQAVRALREAGLQNGTPSGDILYIQWLCLFRSSLRGG